MTSLPRENRPPIRLIYIYYKAKEITTMPVSRAPGTETMKLLLANSNDWLTNLKLTGALSEHDISISEMKMLNDKKAANAKAREKWPLDWSCRRFVIWSLRQSESVTEQLSSTKKTVSFTEDNSFRKES